MDIITSYFCLVGLHVLIFTILLKKHDKFQSYNPNIIELLLIVLMAFMWPVLLTIAILDKIYD